MKTFKITGGARIGMASATFPFATLKVDKNELRLNASIIGNLSFRASDIISIEPYMFIPLIGQGIKINHKVALYHQTIIFWSFKNPEWIIQQIKETGFFSSEDIQEQEAKNVNLTKKQVQGGFPIKREFALLFLVVWNVLFMSDIFMKPDFQKGIFIGKGTLLAVLFLTLISALLLTSNRFRTYVLKEGRGLEDIKRFALFTLLMGLILTILLAPTL